MTANRVYYGIGSHGCEIHCTENGGASCSRFQWFKLPENVKLITIAYPGKGIHGHDFLPVYSTIKSWTESDLNMLFSDTNMSRRVRLLNDIRHMIPSHAHVYYVSLYSQKSTQRMAPDMILDSVVCHNHPKFKRFQKSDKEDVWRHGRYSYQPKEVLTNQQRKNLDDLYYITPLFIKRQRGDVPIPPPFYARMNGKMRPFQGIPDSGHSSERASLGDRIDTANEYWNVDKKLMAKYFDCKTLLSSFVEKECTDPDTKYHIMVMACRGPVMYDTTRVAPPMNSPLGNVTMLMEKNMVRSNKRTPGADPRYECWRVGDELYALYVRDVQFLIDSIMETPKHTNGTRFVLDMIKSLKSCFPRYEYKKAAIRSETLKSYLGGLESCILIKGGVYEDRPTAANPQGLMPRVYGTFVGVVSVQPPSLQQDYVFIYNVCKNPSYTGSGFVRMIIRPLKEVIRFLYSHVRTLKLYVEADNPTSNVDIKAYKGAGFSVTNDRVLSTPHVVMKTNLHSG